MIQAAPVIGNAFRRGHSMSITFRPMDHGAGPPPPDKIYTPARMVDLAKGLERAIAKIEKWEIEVKGSSRLRKTVKLLQEIASVPRFRGSREELRKIAQAAFRRSGVHHHQGYATAEAIGSHGERTQESRWRDPWCDSA